MRRSNRGIWRPVRCQHCGTGGMQHPAHPGRRCGAGFGEGCGCGELGDQRSARLSKSPSCEGSASDEAAVFEKPDANKSWTSTTTT
jgi:hypothetical protein